MVKVLHISHTNINYDSRILKEMNCLKCAGFNVSGVGVRMAEGVSDSELSKDIFLKTIEIWSRNLTFLPKILMHSLTVIEITIKMFFYVIASRPAIIHCHDTIVLPLSVVAKFFTRSKLIYDAHELESNRNGLSPLLGKLTLWVEKILWSKVDRLIVVSPSINSWYQTNIGIKYSEVILNSPVLEVKSEMNYRDYLREKFSIPKNEKIFIYVGILSEGRGIELIVDAFKQLEGKGNVVFLGYGIMENELRQFANDFKSIHCHPAVKHEEVVAIAQSADVGLCFIENVSLSDKFCLPNKLFEYCFSGLPVLSSNLPEIDRLVREFGVGYTSEFKKEEINASIDKFLTGELEFKFNINDLYPLSWQAQEKKLVSFYKALVK